MQMLYASTGYIDELAWAAAWLAKATGDSMYLDDAKKYYAQVWWHTAQPFRWLFGKMSWK